MPPILTTLRPGNTAKAAPFTVLIIANPALEAPWRSGAFIRDPIMGMQSGFDACAQYIDAVLFGMLPGQAERLLGDPTIASDVRVLSLFDSGLSIASANGLVGQDPASTQLIARRNEIGALVARAGMTADVVYAVSASQSHDRATAWPTTDDDTRPGIAFTLDGNTFTHRFRNIVPGTVAIHSSATSLTALHEFQHAISSYSNGVITDLYVDNQPALNLKRGRPIPSGFATYNGVALMSDRTRDSLGYPSGWKSYQCALINQTLPAAMDDYWAKGAPSQCENDAITREFVLDRVRAKMCRP